jgi:hypothetical protein
LLNKSIIIFADLFYEFFSVMYDTGNAHGAWRQMGEGSGAPGFSGGCAARV